jgi:hypothetical protein
MRQTLTQAAEVTPRFLGIVTRQRALRPAFERLLTHAFSSETGNCEGAACNPELLRFFKLCSRDDIIGRSNISTDVEYAKAVAWFYDPGHELGQGVDTVRLRFFDGTSNVATSGGGADNVQRVYLKHPGGKPLYIRLSGDQVYTDNHDGCGTSQIRVFYAAYYEDADRDDSDGPHSSDPVQIEADYVP